MDLLTEQHDVQYIRLQFSETLKLKEDILTDDKIFNIFPDISHKRYVVCGEQKHSGYKATG